MYTYIYIYIIVYTMVWIALLFGPEDPALAHTVLHMFMNKCIHTMYTTISLSLYIYIYKERERER